MLCDYYSNFIEVENIIKANTTGNSKALKTMFARYSIPDMQISDNGPQFALAFVCQKNGLLNMSCLHHIILSPMEKLTTL